MSYAHTPPKPDSYKHSYQAWRHAPGQSALKGHSCSHALPPLCGSSKQSALCAHHWAVGHEPPHRLLGTQPHELKNASHAAVACHTLHAAVAVMPSPSTAHLHVACHVPHTSLSHADDSIQEHPHKLGSKPTKYLSMPTHHPNWIATSTATRHGGTHRGNRLLRATAAHTHSPHSAAQVSRVHCVHTTGPSGMSHRTDC